MTPIVESEMSGPDLGGDNPPTNKVLTSNVCFPGGYSVWDCPPLEPQLPTPEQGAGDVTLLTTSARSRLGSKENSNAVPNFSRLS